RLVECAVDYLRLRRCISGIFFLPLLPRFESEHLCCCKCSRRRRTESCLDRHVRICPASHVLRRLVAAHRDSARARLVVDPDFGPLLSTDPHCSHFERRESACTRTTWIHRLSNESHDSAYPFYFVEQSTLPRPPQVADCLSRLLRIDHDCPAARLDVLMWPSTSMNRSSAVNSLSRRKWSACVKPASSPRR